MAKATSLDELLEKSSIRRVGKNCFTCEEPKWVALIDEYLTKVERGQYDKRKASLRWFHGRLRDDYEALGVPKYTHARSALIGHIERGCRPDEQPK